VDIYTELTLHFHSLKVTTSLFFRQLKMQAYLVTQIAMYLPCQLVICAEAWFHQHV